MRFAPHLKTLAGRVAILVILFSLEALLSPLFRGTHGSVRIPEGAWLTGLVHASAASIARFAIAFSALFATFALLRYRDRVQTLALGLPYELFRPGLAVLHLASVGLFWMVSPGVYAAGTATDSNLASLVWTVSAALAVSSAALAFLPWQWWRAALHATGKLWLYSAVSAALICASIVGSRMLWRSVSRLTFSMVAIFLHPFVSDLVIQPDALRIGTHRFTVVIANECSGVEGIGLLLVFGCMWLFLFREEARFPQALAILPLGIVTLFVLNAARLAALVLIGDAGAPDIAAGGFHSQAGWIMFNSVAFGSAVAARRWSWVSILPGKERATREASNATAAFLMPFLAILAAGMISRAGSGAFEWLYPLRFFAAAAALWWFRPSYSGLNWKAGAAAIAAGLAVFVVWIGADRTAGPAAMPEALAAAPAGIRDAWIGLRVLGAVFTVPLAEELAFRGFLMRRLTAPEFDSVPFGSVSWTALLVSSLLFGAMHGRRWAVATLAGLVFGLIVKRTGRIGDAVVAHAVTNALLAIAVLWFNQWQFW